MCWVINTGYFGNIKSVLNLELTGFGEKWIIGKHPGDTFNKITETFKDARIVDVPRSDTDIIRENGIDSVDKINTNHMQHFVENILSFILKLN